MFLLSSSTSFEHVDLRNYSQKHCLFCRGEPLKSLQVFFFFTRVSFSRPHRTRSVSVGFVLSGHAINNSLSVSGRRSLRDQKRRRFVPQNNVRAPWLATSGRRQRCADSLLERIRRQFGPKDNLPAGSRSSLFSSRSSRPHKEAQSTTGAVRGGSIRSKKRSPHPELRQSGVGRRPIRIYSSLFTSC